MYLTAPLLILREAYVYHTNNTANYAGKENNFMFKFRGNLTFCQYLIHEGVFMWI